MDSPCPWCWEVIPTPLQLLEHITEKHAPSQTVQPQEHANSQQLQQPTSSQDTKSFICEKCEKVFQHKRSLTRHKREKHSDGEKLICEKCPKTFSSLRLRKKHEKTVHSSECKKFKCKQREGRRRPVIKRLHCKKCNLVFSDLKKLYQHKRQTHPHRLLRTLGCNGCGRKFSSQSTAIFHRSSCPLKRRKERSFHQRAEKSLYPRPTEEESPTWVTETAMGGDALIHRFRVTSEFDLQLTLLTNKKHVERVLGEDIATLRRMKWYLTACINVQAKEGEEGEAGGRLMYLRCSPIVTLRRDEIPERVGESILGVLNSFDKSVAEGSQILFNKVEWLELRVAKYSPLKGSSFLPLPDWLSKSSKGLINIQNFADSKCFLWSVLAGINLPRKHPQRVSKYRNRERELNMRGIQFPVSLQQIDTFERNNRHVGVTVFGLENERDIIPLRTSKLSNRQHHVNLLLLLGNEKDENHYVLIRDKSRFLAHLSKRKKKLFWCDNCTTPYPTQEAHDRHRKCCLYFNAQAVCMPEGLDLTLKFTDFEKQQRHDYVIYCDLESVLVPVSTCKPNPEVSNTTILNQHVACGFCYIIMGPDGKLLKEPVLEHGKEGLIKHLLLCLKEEETNIQKLRGKKYDIDMTPDSWKKFEEAKNCYLCGSAIPRVGVKKVRDHNHFKEKDNFRGAACSGCNLNMKSRDFIPVFFHNFSGYDAHHLVAEIGTLSDGHDISAIPKTKEKYISFSWGKLRFLDSLNFLSASLEKLVRDLKPEDLISLASVFPDADERGLLSRKGVYPYTYFNCFEKFEETRLPPRECFWNDLSNESISESDYEHAQSVFQKFGMTSLWDYHDLYLMTDTVLLCDVMEAYRRLSMENFKLDVVHYYTTPGFTWSAAMLFTQQKLELLDDINMYQMFERGLRGGVSTINHRLAKANNHYIPENFDDKEDREFILYVDANNLYGCGLSHTLPVGDFMWLTPSDIEALNIAEIKETDSTGYLFEVSLRYPEQLHDLHNDYCLAPEHVVPKFKHLSPLQKKMIRKFNLPKECKTKKLVPNLYDKDHYVCYGTTLKLYLELGMEIDQIHRVISFSQKPWLAPYIHFNTSMRQKAESEFQKSLWKLFNNSVFGKAIENIRNRRNVNFTKNKDKFRKLVRSPLFHSFDIFDYEMVVVERRKAKVRLNKPVYLGQVILDVSKEVMYNYHYKCMKPVYGDKIKVCGTDTDSLIYSIKTHDLYADMKKMTDWMDTSDYPSDHALFSVRNKKVLGKFKDEMNGVPIAGFVGLRPKMYSFLTGENKEKCVGKGIPRAALKSQLSFGDYKNCIENFSVKSVTFSKIGTDGRHHLFTTFSTKKGLSCYDDKRYLLSDNVNTLAYGHYKLREVEGSSDDEEVDEGEKNLEELILITNDL